MKFKTEQEAIDWVRLHIPIAIKPTKKAKTTFVFPFRGINAYEIVVNHLGKELFKH